MADYAPRVGFGPPLDPLRTAYFGILMPDTSDAIPDWSAPANIATHVFPGAFPPRMEIEVISFAPSVVTWRLALDSRADYHKLLALLGKTAILTVLAGLQSHLGTFHQDLGLGYMELPQTTLMELSNQAFYVGGDVEVDATFLRQVDPETAMAVPT